MTNRTGSHGSAFVVDDPADARDVRAAGAQRAVVTAASAALQGPGEPLETASPVARGRSAIVRRVEGLLLARIEADDLTACEHIEEGVTGAWWLPSAPQSYICDLCVAALRRPIRCDACTKPAPGRVTRFSLVRGPVTVLSFLCPRCTTVMAVANGAPT